jgi:outer membrane receptor protein involved in Fe transport
MMSNRVRAGRARLALISGCAVCSTLGVLSTDDACAQQAGGQNAEGRATLEEVVVTSRRREESLQDVPIAVSAFSAESIERNRIEGVDDVFSRTPNVAYTTEGSRDRKRLSIRGVTEFITEAGEATVPANTFGIYIDDFSVATATSNPGVMDIERIEVLRGPQGTYFGRNAVGGALNITTKKPTNEFFSEVTADVSRYDTYELDGTLNLPITDTLAMRANVKYQESDGYIKNINPIGGGNDSEYKYGRLSLRYTPNELLAAEHQSRQLQPAAGSRLEVRVHHRACRVSLGQRPTHERLGLSGIQDVPARRRRWRQRGFVLRAQAVRSRRFEPGVPARLDRRQVVGLDGRCDLQPRSRQHRSGDAGRQRPAVRPAGRLRSDAQHG